LKKQKLTKTFTRKYLPFDLSLLSEEQQLECEQTCYTMSGPEQEYYEIEVSSEWFKDKLEEWNLPFEIPKISPMEENGYYTVMLQYE
jgi:hypothetical protein